MLPTIIVFFQACYLVPVVLSQSPGQVPSPPVLVASQVIPPISANGEGSSATQQQDFPTPSSTEGQQQYQQPTEGRPHYDPNASGGYPPNSQPNAGTDGSSYIQQQSPSQYNQPSEARPDSEPKGFSSSPSQLQPPSIPMSTNSTKTISFDIDDLEINGALPNLTLIVSNTSNSTKIVIKSNNTKKTY